MAPSKAFHYLTVFSLLAFCTFAQPPKGPSPDDRILTPLTPVGGVGLPSLDNDVCATLACRELNGLCTSSTNPNFGRARLPQFSYTDSSSEIPTGQTLRSAREISNLVCSQSSNTVNFHGINELFTFYGAFMVHNFAATPGNPDETLDIPVPESEVSELGEKLPFIRSMRGVTLDGESQRPINTLTSALDLAGVYGPEEVRNRALLETENGKLTGKLKTSADNLMPLNTPGLFNAPDTSDEFFLAGDHRANEHNAMVALHTLFVREHNTLVDMIKEELPTLPPRRLYEYARKFNIALFQKIVYEEFYPAIISRRLGRYGGFRRGVDPTLSDIFTGAAFRIGHTLVGMNLPRRGPDGDLTPIEREELFFRPASKFSSAEMDDTIRGLANGPAQEVDAQVVDLLRNFLFTNVPQEEGIDLAAINIQRGRDHALPKFNEIREIFGISRARSFRAITRNTEVARALSEAYNGNVDDVEAFVGLIAEDQTTRDGMGRTMAAVWRTEFTRLRDGDQFFYLNTRMLPRLLRTRFRAFTRMLRRRSLTTLRDMIVRNTDITEEQLPTGNIFNLNF